MRKEVKRHLKVQLPDAELQRLGEDLARLEMERVAIETKRSAAARKYGKLLKETSAKIEPLASSIADGFAWRPVDCMADTDFNEMTLTVWRRDTLEIVEQRPLREDEKQIPLGEVTNQMAIEYLTRPVAAVCDTCGRVTWAEWEVGGACGKPNSSGGDPCRGSMDAYDPNTAAAEADSGHDVGPGDGVDASPDTAAQGAPVAFDPRRHLAVHHGPPEGQIEDGYACFVHDPPPDAPWAEHGGEIAVWRRLVGNDGVWVFCTPAEYEIEWRARQAGEAGPETPAGDTAE